MKKLKVIVGLALVLMLGFSMAACTGDSAVNGSYSAMVGETEYVLVLAKNGEYSLSSVSATEKTLLNSGVFEVSGDKLTLQDNSGKQIVVPLTDSKPRFIFNGVELNFAKHATTLATVAITFESNGGSTIKSISTVLSGSKILAPAPTKSGATFAGWYLDSALTQKFNAKTQAFLANATLYAKWEAAHVHAYGEWVITTPATCTTAGEKTKTCACGDKVTEIIPAGHTYGDWVVTTPATCTTAGERTRTCSVCKKVETEIIPAGHSYGEWTITPATCTTPGKKTKTCSVCGDKVEEIIPSTGEHAYGVWTIKTPATCTTAGERTRTCSVCGSVETEVIHAGHSYGEWTIKTPATCSTAGERTRTCSVCKKVETEAIPALEHGYGGWIETETGVTRECTVCHQTEVVPYTAGLQFADVDVGGTLVHMVTGLGTAATASTICIPKTHDGKPVGGIGSSVFAGEVTPTAPPSFVPTFALARVIIPSSVTSVGEFAFYFCPQLTDVMFAGVSKLTSIGMGAFAYCIALADITLPSSVTSIGMATFLNCFSLTSFNIPNGVTTIGEMSFAYMPLLASITIPSSVTSIGDGAFDRCPLLANIEVDPANANYQSIDGNLYNKAGTTLLLYAPGKTATSFCIPSSVTSILGGNEFGGGAFSDCENLITVTFEAGSKLASIGYMAFNGCTLLAAITIPSSVTSIGGSAFSSCRYLATVTFEAGSLLASIGDRAFGGCTSLADIIIPSGVTSLGNLAFEGCRNLATVTFEAGSKLASIGNRAFDRCTSLASIIIPSSVTRIEEYAFSSYLALTIYAEAAEKPTGWHSNWNYSNCPVVWNCKTNEVAADGYIYTIQDGVRYGIKNGEAMVAKQPNTTTTIKIATSITYQGTTYAVTSIGQYSFEDCTSLASITIPSSVTSIGDSAFSRCTKLATVTFEAGSKLTFIGNSAFQGCTSLTSVTIPSSVTSVESNAFRGCTKLATVTFEAGSKLASIGNNVFFGCTSLTSITIPSSVTSIDSYAFEGCTNLTTVTFEAGSKLTSIGWGVFRGCTSLASITIVRANANYQSIEGNLYNKAGTTLLLYAPGKTATSFSVPSSVTSIESYAFYGCTSLASVTIPSGVTSIGGGAFEGCTALASITVDPANANYQSIEGNLYNKAGTELIQYAVGKTATSFSIPSSVTSIESGAFDSCTSLASVTIPSGVTRIWYEAFKNCKNLATVTFAAGSKLAFIGENAFYGCTSLAAITIPSGVTSIEGVNYGQGAFYGCTNLATVTFAAGSQLTSIGDQAFYGCTSLASITIPSSVSRIGWGAFYGCTSLTSIIIPSSVISIGYMAFGGCPALTFYAEAAEKPTGWDSGWDNSEYANANLPVVWSCSTITNAVADDGYIYTIQDGVRYGIKNGKAMVAEQPSTITTANIAVSITYQGNIYPVTSMERERIGYNANRGVFEGCTKLATVTFAAGSLLTSIAHSAFSGCTSLAAIIIPSSVTSISGYAFEGCTNLATVTFEAGSKLTSIAHYAFQGCTSLAAITIPSGVNSIEYNAFRGCAALAAITVDPANSYFQSIDGNLYNRAGTTLLQYAVGKTATSYTIPSSVTSIGNAAFYGCTSLTSITIPSSVTSIGIEVFYNSKKLATVTFAAGSKLTMIELSVFSGCTSLASITIPSSVTSIGNSAFSGCTKLTTITFAAGSKLTRIEGGAFRNCTALTAITIPSSVTVIMGDSVGSLPVPVGQAEPNNPWGYAPFSGCTSLATVTFEAGSKLTSIGNWAFSGCTALTSIIIPSSVTRMDNYAFNGCTTLVVYVEAAEKPLGWHRDWSDGCGQVYWFSATAPAGAPATGNGFWHDVGGVPTKW